MSAEREAEVIAVLRRYSVRAHYRASAAGPGMRYAVFREGRQMTEPAPHPAACASRDELTAADIVALFGREAGRA